MRATFRSLLAVPLLFLLIALGAAPAALAAPPPAVGAADLAPWAAGAAGDTGTTGSAETPAESDAPDGETDPTALRDSNRQIAAIVGAAALFGAVFLGRRYRKKKK
ncbi:hypothetical protein C1701_14365 [Actinoalloteichus sp. AHMU CJ021]|uniref:LPXTG cell wall anchor domain-containing protein n=1 Tax=Actinoalloteichus caeruleus DSM 43889 TaxID=1120930 RepID=A0ABT1JM85_ACTCY|nr:hypothetical protein [Actinoalloteichus caeruleus]AUS79350.1 hypothetical protein C1701_14365 [Actinoalloteichus sp. AHMU CJ021]MCP2333639.1 hypothetical protein [Actinoalloteichus caeruleus DSM 43889]